LNLGNNSGSDTKYFQFIIPLSRILLKKLTFTQPVKKLPVFYGTKKFITATGPYPEPDENFKL
jgi:hypothetical protein